MKKDYLSSATAVIIIIAILFSNCKKNGDIKLSNELTQNDRNLITLYTTAGDIHNRGIDYIFKKIEKRLTYRSNGRLSIVQDSIAFSELNAMSYQYVIDSLHATDFDFTQYYGLDNTQDSV